MSWEKVKLGDICESISDGDHLPPPKSVDGIPFVTISNVNSSNQFDFKNTMFVPQEYYEKLDEKRKPRINDILYSVVGSFGIPVFIKENRPFVFQRHIAILRPNESRIHPRYLYYKMLSKDFYMKADAVAIGAAQRTISLTSLRNMEISIPCKDSQKRIADILSAYDNLIENNQKQIKLLEEAAQRLYKQWFIDLRYPGHETTKIVDGLPEGWRKVTLGSALSKITTGLNPRKNFVLGQGKNFYVTIKNMGDNNIYLDDKCDRVNDEALEKINKRSDLKTGDILFSGIGTIGRVYLIDIPTNNWNVSESVFTMRVNECVSKEFLYLMLLSDDVQSYCDLHAHGVAQRGIRMADLKEYKFVLPENKIIDSFTTMVEPIIEKTQILRKSINSAAESRDRLLPKLMNGELEI